MNRIMITIVIFLLIGIFPTEQSSKSKTPNLVPDSLTARSVAEVILVKYYGENVKKRFPLKISEDSKKEVWILKGIIKERKGYVTMGGVPYIEIRKKDCCILKMTHGK